jgi:cephalosporin-C deacetylase-like acetyl esterase
VDGGREDHYVLRSADMKTQPARATHGRGTVHRPTIVRRGLLRISPAVLLIAACAEPAQVGPPGAAEAEAEPSSVTASPVEEASPVTEEPASAADEMAWDELDDNVQREDPAVFDYEQVRPVPYEVVETVDFQGIEVELITFESAVGGTATGHLMHPVGEPVPGAAVLTGHGVPVDGSDNYDVMAIFACAGATTLVIDAPFARPGGAGLARPITFTEQDRLDHIQLIVDMRRGLDILSDLGATELGFGGGSYGASMGAQLIGVDDRVKAAVLVLPSAGVVGRFTGVHGAPIGPLADRPDEDARDWITTMLPLEPIHFVGDTEAEVLFMSGKKDPLVPPADAAEVHAAGPPGSEVHWMDGGHEMPFADMTVHNEFVGDRIGLDAERLGACTSELFPEGW